MKRALSPQPAPSARIVLILLIAAILCLGPLGGPLWLSAQDAAPSGPLGFRDGVAYGPRVTRDDGKVIEDTNYDVQNPDLKGTTCFGVGWEELWHSGQDLYRTDGKSTAGAEVTAVADGNVAYANPDINYPGLVVILEHRVEGQTFYTVYAHLNDTSLEVREGESVTRGQRLGTVLKQRYTGRFPEQHPSGDDSHLHFEVRRFLSARAIYKAASDCNGMVAGRATPIPATPRIFPLPARATPIQGTTFSHSGAQHARPRP